MLKSLQKEILWQEMKNLKEEEEKRLSGRTGRLASFGPVGYPAGLTKFAEFV